MFHLGTLSYLYRLKFDNGENFLDCVKTISSISGGTLIALCYIQAILNHEAPSSFFRRFYWLLYKSNPLESALDNLLRRNIASSSLIKEISAIYDEIFFKGEVFGLILSGIENSKIHHFCSSGTDFSNGLQFRFQATHNLRKNKDFPYGIIGNFKNRINRDIASKIKLSEIMAVSSSFPAVFEPFKFPEDFQFCNDIKESDLDKLEKISIMDGGVADNQGIEPVILANDQMNLERDSLRRSESIDLIIISDVSSAKIANFDYSIDLPIIKSLSLHRLGVILDILLIAFIILFSWSLHYGYDFLLGFSTGLIFVLLLLYNLYAKTRKYLSKKASSIYPFLSYELFKYKKVKEWDVILSNRISSLLTLAISVFMKVIRKLKYSTLYADKRWENRLISNIIGELSSEGSWKKKKSELISPSKEMQSISDIASSTETTLWFSEEHKRRNVPEALLATGQYNICMNLIEYLEKLKKNKNNTGEFHRRLFELEEQLRNDWLEFQKDPMFLIKEVKGE